MECSKCKSSRNVKNGHINGLQRYKCKDCGRSFTVELKSTAKAEDVKRQALLMYLEGLGFSSIGRILRVSHVSVLNWVRKYGREIESIRSDKPVQIMELDEIHTYIGHKKTIDGFGLLLVEDDREYVDFVVGNRGTKTGLRLWEKVGKLAHGAVMADYWKSYNDIVPSKQLIQTKAETYTVESYNGLIRHFLARFRRKTKCYSKSEEMLELTLKLFFAHRNKTLSIFDY